MNQAQIQKLLTLCGVAAANAATFAPILAQSGGYGIGDFTDEHALFFLANAFNETGRLSRLRESCYYTNAAYVRQVFGSRVANVDLTPYLSGNGVDNTVKFANLVYANILGNGNEASGDGAAFRGAGLVQTTGRANFMVLQQKIAAEDAVISAAGGTPSGLNVVQHPEALSQPKWAVFAGVAFWNNGRCSQKADAVTFASPGLTLEQSKLWATRAVISGGTKQGWATTQQNPGVLGYFAMLQRNYPAVQSLASSAPAAPAAASSSGAPPVDPGYQDQFGCHPEPPDSQ